MLSFLNKIIHDNKGHFVTWAKKQTGITTIKRF